jgi:23S rRNA (adenine2030-N6)-methyltransferase
MKYRHSFHAGNFADVHKHVTLLALLRALTRKDKGLFYLDTHAGRGAYDLSSPTAEAAAGVGRFLSAAADAPELTDYASLIARLREPAAHRYLYPGSPLIAAASLRAQDRAVLIEQQGGEAHALESALAPFGAAGPHLVVERGDGFERLRAWLPPRERRGLTFIDPPYESSHNEFAFVSAALAESMRRFPTGVCLAWYPIKDERDSSAWVSACVAALGREAMMSELWLYPRDSKVALNGSGLLIVNPPWQLLERTQVWLPQLLSCLKVGEHGGIRAQMVSQSAT